MSDHFPYHMMKAVEKKRKMNPAEQPLDTLLTAAFLPPLCVLLIRIGDRSGSVRRGSSQSTGKHFSPCFRVRSWFMIYKTWAVARHLQWKTRNLRKVSARSAPVFLDQKGRVSWVHPLPLSHLRTQFSSCPEWFCTRHHHLNWRLNWDNVGNYL